MTTDRSKPAEGDETTPLDPQTSPLASLTEEEMRALNKAAREGRTNVAARLLVSFLKEE